MSGIITIGDGQNYSTHALAVAALATAIGGDWTNNGKWYLLSYPKAGHYIDDKIDTSNLLNADANNHAICVAMVNHFGNRDNGIIIKLEKDDVNYYPNELGDYDEIYGYNITVNGTGNLSGIPASGLLILGNNCIAERNFIRDADLSKGSSYGIGGIYCGFNTGQIIRNNFISNIKYIAVNGGVGGISLRGGASISTIIENNTVCNMQGVTRTFGIGTDTVDQIIASCKNNICFNMLGVSGNACYFRFNSTNHSNNVSSDNSALGTNYLRYILSSNELVNDTPGSEDLHLKAGAQSIGSGLDLSGSFVRDIDNSIRTTPWDRGADAYGITPPPMTGGKLTVGTGKSYLTHVAAVQSLLTMTSGDWTNQGIWTIESYKGNYVDDYIDLAAGFSNADVQNHPICISKEYHLGNKDKGIIISVPFNSSAGFTPIKTGEHGKISGYVFKINGSGGYTAIPTPFVHVGSFATFERNVIADFNLSKNSYVVFVIQPNGQEGMIVRNNFIQNINWSGTDTTLVAFGIRDKSICHAKFDNNTIRGMSGGTAARLIYSNGKNMVLDSCKNNLVFDPSASIQVCFFSISGTNASNNVSSDATAIGANYLRSVSSLNELLNVTPGSDDLHLKAGAQSIGSGLDLSPEFTDDVDGATRILPWDRGADAYNLLPPPPELVQTAEIIGNSALLSRAEMIGYIGNCFLR